MKGRDAQEEGLFPARGQLLVMLRVALLRGRELDQCLNLQIGLPFPGSQMTSIRPGQKSMKMLRAVKGLSRSFLESRG